MTSRKYYKVMNCLTEFFRYFSLTSIYWCGIIMSTIFLESDQDDPAFLSIVQTEKRGDQSFRHKNWPIYHIR